MFQLNIANEESTMWYKFFFSIKLHAESIFLNIRTIELKVIRRVNFDDA